MSFFDHMTPEQIDLIENVHIFFVASVATDLSAGPDGEGAVNISPKGGTPLHVIDPHTLAYLDYSGSGNETARHAATGGPVTVMVTSFEKENAATVRLYGRATTTPVEDSPLKERLLAAANPADEPPRQVITVRVEKTQTSCGYSIPVFEYVAERGEDDRGRRYK